MRGKKGGKYMEKERKKKVIFQIGLKGRGVIEKS